MNISRRHFLNSVGSTLAASQTSLLSGIAHAAQSLTHNSLSAGYVTNMIEAITRIASYPGKLDTIINDYLIAENKEFFAHDIAMHTIHGRGCELMLLTRTDLRDRHSLVGNKRFVAALDKLALPHDILFDDRKLIAQLFADAAQADRLIKQYLPYSSLKNETGKDPLSFLERRFFPLEDLTANMPRHLRLLSHYEINCFHCYGLKPRVTIRDTLTLSQLHVENWGNIDLAVKDLDNFSSEKISYLGPYTTKTQRAFWRQLHDNILQYTIPEDAAESVLDSISGPPPNQISQFLIENITNTKNDVLVLQNAAPPEPASLMADKGTPPSHHLALRL